MCRPPSFFSDALVLARAVEADFSDGRGAPLPRAARPPRPGQRQRRRGRRQRITRFGYRVPIQLARKLLEKSLEKPLEKTLKNSHTGKTPKNWVF